MSVLGTTQIAPHFGAKQRPQKTLEREGYFFA
jgi:hypothetical protein